MQTSPSQTARAPISHPYPPAYRPRSNSPPSQSYGYDQRRRPSAASSDSNPFGDNRGVQGFHNGGSDIDVKGEISTAALGPGASAARGPKIGKGQYAENWTKEDEDAEREFLKQGMFNWKELMNWRFWIRKKWWYWYIIIIVLCVLVALMTLYHDQIVTWLTPVANWMKNLPAGWTIPIAVLFILSFPPLFGQEIVCVLVGAVWGLWVGFGIVSAGTFIGEIGNFYAFKYCLRSYAMRLEEKEPTYACLAHIVREGGFFLIFVIRLSAIPGHFSTAVFATCGMNIWIFSAATILTLPKQLIIVYLGVIFADQTEKTNKERIITWTTLIIGLSWSAWYIYKKMQKARLVLWRRERLANKAAAAQTGDTTLGASGGAALNRRISYREMLEQPNDDIEALRPMLHRVSEEGQRPYETPYDIKQVQISSSLRNSNVQAGQIDFSEPPSYHTSPTSPGDGRRGTAGSPTAPSRKESDLLPTNPDPPSPVSPPIDSQQAIKVQAHSADTSSYNRNDQMSYYEVNDAQSTNPPASHNAQSTQAFPSARPYKPTGNDDLNRYSSYGGAQYSPRDQYTGGGYSGEGDLGARDSYAAYPAGGQRPDHGDPQYGQGQYQRGYQLRD